MKWLTTALWLLSAPLIAQRATITGRVVADSDGSPIVAVSVAVSAEHIGTVTDAAGRFRFSPPSPGIYVVAARSIGYRTDSSRIVVTAPDEKIILNFRLVTAAVSGQEIVVNARADRASDASARLTEQNSPTVVNVMSAEAIARYPDPSTAEAVKRIPGISITRVRGEAREAIVRGMEGRYNNTLIDGLKVPSPSTTSRVVQLDYLPSDLLQRVEVTKSLTPDMEGDAIGGTVNLVMRTAPDDFVLRGRIGTGYSSQLVSNDFIGFRTDSIFDDPIELHGRAYQASDVDFPRDNLKLTRRQAPPDLLGEFTVGDRFMDKRLGLIVAGSVQQTYRHSITTRNYDAVDPDNNTYLIRRQYRFHGHDKTKWGLNAKADYIFDSSNEIEASFTGFLRQNRESRILNDTNFVYSPVLYISERSVFQTYTLAQSVLSGKHALGNFDIKWRGGWAEATQRKPDRAELTTSTGLIGDSVVSQRILYAATRDWQHNDDRDFFGGADISWKGLADLGITITAGGQYRTKYRENYQNAYRLSPVTDSLGYLPEFTSVDSARWEVLNLGGTPDYGDNNYTSGEDIGAVYLMGTWEVGDFNVLGGVRLESTTADYATFNIEQVAHISAEKSYTDVLPSLHIRYALNPESNIRLSVGQSISRPNFFDLVPYNYVGDEYREIGNPYLKRTHSTNVDVRYEVVPGNNRQFSVGTFYKLIQDPIEQTLDLSNPAIPAVIPKNLGDATNFGVEFVAGTDFLEYFNVQANYTYTHSSITTDKIRYDRTTGKTITVQETRPLQGQSEHIGNIALAFRNPDWGTFAQASFVFTGRRIAQVNIYANLNHYQTDFPVFDVSFDQKIVGNLSLFLRLNNLLNAPYQVEIENGTLIEREQFGESATIGLNFQY